MPLTRLPLAAALLALALSAGAARAEQVAITGQTGSPLTTTNGLGTTINGTTSQTFRNGLSVSTAGAGAAVIGLGPLPTDCTGLAPGTPYDAGGSSPAICRDASYVALNSGGHILLNGGGALLTNP